MAIANVIFNYPDYADLRDRNRSFSGLAAFHMTSMNLMEAGRPERVWGVLVSGNYFDVVGVRPVMGRGFLAANDNKPGGSTEAAISYSFWQTHYGGRGWI